MRLLRWRRALGKVILMVSKGEKLSLGLSLGNFHSHSWQFSGIPTSLACDLQTRWDVFVFMFFCHQGTSISFFVPVGA